MLATKEREKQAGKAGNMAMKQISKWQECVKLKKGIKGGSKLEECAQRRKQGHKQANYWNVC